MQARGSHRPPEPHGHARYNLFSPYMTCPTGKDGLNRIGNDGEGGKMICTELLKGEDCVVFSLGSNGALFFFLIVFILIDMKCFLELIVHGE